MKSKASCTSTKPMSPKCCGWAAAGPAIAPTFFGVATLTAATTDRGRLIYGLLIGFLVYVIRAWGGYPDGIAFAVLLANMCVPLIDYYIIALAGSSS